MGKVKGLLMDMEDDAHDMTYKQFTDKWGESYAHIWYEQHGPFGTVISRSSNTSDIWPL